MNRRLFILISALALFIAGCGRAGNNGPTLDGKDIDPFVYGVYGVYGDEVPETEPAPEGFRPVYISHYGRHGSRYILHDTQYTYVAQVLEKAFNDGLLTPKGLELHQRYMSIFPQLEGKAGKITPLGEKQHRDIADRMYTNFQPLFDGHRTIALSTNLQRTKKSMQAFESMLLEHNPKLKISAKVSVKDMYYLNPQSNKNPNVTEADLQWKDNKSPMRKEFEEYLQQYVDWKGFGSRIFTDLDKASELCDIEKFELDLYFICIHMPGVPVESKGFFDFFTADELENLAAFGDNYVMYVRFGHHPKSNGRGYSLSESLLNDFITKADSDMVAGEPRVRLRFGHDGCIVALFSMMGLDGWNGVESDPTRFRNVWDVSKIKMASNIQFIFYVNDEGTTLVHMLFNEADTKLPFKSYKGTKYYYRWDDFKNYYQPRIEEARVLLARTSKN